MRITHKDVEIINWRDGALEILGQPQESPEDFEQHLDRAIVLGDLISFEDFLEWRLRGHSVPLASYHEGTPGHLRAYGQPASRDNFMSALCDWVNYTLDDTPVDIESIS